MQRVKFGIIDRCIFPDIIHLKEFGIHTHLKKLLGKYKLNMLALNINYGSGFRYDLILRDEIGLGR